MKWKKKRLPPTGNDCEIKKFFAWKPFVIKEDVVWLETCYVFGKFYLTSWTELTFVSEIEHNIYLSMKKNERGYVSWVDLRKATEEWDKFSEIIREQS